MAASTWLLNVVKRTSLLFAIQVSVAVILAFYLGSLVSRLFLLSNPIISGLWCAISAILVVQVLVNETIESAWLRIVGSFCGSLTSFIVASIFGYGLLALVSCMFVTIILLALLKLTKTYRLTCITIAVIIAIGMSNPTLPPWINSLSRFIESVLGAAIATVLVIIFLPLREMMNHSPKSN